MLRRSNQVAFNISRSPTQSAMIRPALPSVRAITRKALREVGRVADQFFRNALESPRIFYMNLQPTNEDRPR